MVPYKSEHFGDLAHGLKIEAEMGPILGCGELRVCGLAQTRTVRGDEHPEPSLCADWERANQTAARTAAGRSSAS